MPPDQTPPKPYVRSQHAGELVHDLRLIIGLGGPVLFLLIIGEILLRATGRINSLVLVLLLIPGNLLIIAGLMRLIQAVSGATADALAKTVYGAGNLPPEPGFSAEEAMIIQGRLDDAESALRRRLTEQPELHQAGLRLGALLVQMNRPEEAERVYLDLRRKELPPAIALTVANRLIDLYERTRRTDRLKVELARFSGEHPGTGAGEGAARRLREIKEQEATRKDEEGED